jgi:hypothetical protein
LRENFDVTFAKLAPAWRVRTIAICSRERTAAADDCATSNSNQIQNVNSGERGSGSAVVTKPELIGEWMAV